MFYGSFSDDNLNCTVALISIVVILYPSLIFVPFRVVAPDFIGCGRSDKLLLKQSYTHALHVASLVHLLDALDLKVRPHLSRTYVMESQGETPSIKNWVGTENKRSTAFPRVILYNLMNLHVICMQHFLLDQLVKILMTVTRKQSFLFIFFYSWHFKLSMINGEDC